jgi:hypothetical protein
MLRRFEIYAVDPDAPEAARRAMDVGIRDCGKYIPELLHSAIGHAESESGLNFVWEHAYESPKSYQRYMAHPYHAAILDRFLLNDSPERIIMDNSTGLGLAGYECESGDCYLLPAGAARRVVALGLKPGSENEFARIAEAEGSRGSMLLSVFKENTFADKWFDGETSTGLPTPVTHMWEQGFATMEAARAYDPQWRTKAGAIVESAVELLYEVEAGWGYPDVEAP